MKPMFTDDPIADFEAHDRAQTKRLAQLPECDYCHNPIQDEHYFDINGDVMGEKCLNNNFRKENVF